MAEVKQNKEKSKTATVRLPKINKPNAPQEEFLSLNFKNYIIKRGEKVEVPAELAEVIENAQLAEDYAIDYAESVKVREPKSEI